MNAGQAGKLVSKFIDRIWPDDKAQIFEILFLAINKAWNEGAWFGMTKEGYVRVEYSKEGRYVIGPADHPILLAININGEPQDIRSHHFKFHRNGNGRIENCNGCKWETDVIDKGEVPYINEEKINLNDGFFVGVRPIGKPGPGEKIWINGVHEDGSNIFTYKKSSDKLDACGCLIDDSKIDTIRGIELDISEGYRYIKNVKFSDIKSITKTLTRTPVEVIAFDCNGKAQMMARLEPHQKRSNYRKYILPDRYCKYDSIHGLFKVAEQQEIISESDDILIKDPEALIALCKSIDLIYYKGQEDKGAGFFLQGITILEKKKREQESPDTFPIQVDFLTGTDDGTSILNYL